MNSIYMYILQSFLFLNCNSIYYNKTVGGSLRSDNTALLYLSLTTTVLRVMIS